MSEIVINNYSSIPDAGAAWIVYLILNGSSAETICRLADDAKVDVGVRTDDATGKKTFTVTDRD